MSSLPAPLSALPRVARPRHADAGPRETAPPRRLPPAAPGPVLLGDIHGHWGGRPMLLHLWAAWDAARDGGRD